ncbi:GMC family oxidoreductase N-terminal domain-containing protein [Streptomyces sp. ITFR-6]|uniref:GMC family oxidoreductase n=1 Tax=Streptomyces sp. ITFR-6 TaxID=3075197 RepID=UPI00288B1C95|nr:GMC family oxidoreductase N-terminal domain-containing protein [Streptomyces sp. ITFR-6]WNI28727.1 GMC family oxidoreductase N-terminal domain-containing protein [Streptomyces sp. ITFR-6]
MDYDYVIVGAGAAGAVLANRLSENTESQVLLLEYGPIDANPLHSIPKGFFFTLNGSRYTYHYPTQPITGGSASETWTRGKVLGGSTTVNGMMYSRGSRADFDALEKHTGAGHWGWTNVLAAFRTMEDHQLGPSELRGAGGPLGISIDEPHEPVTDALMEAGQAAGWRRVADLNAAEDERIGFTPSTVKNGRRVSSATAFLRPVRRRKNLTVMTGARVGYLQFDGRRVIGVRASVRGRVQDFRARREVIVSAGTIESTLLLERSGIGSPEVLRAAGITPVVESPNVGERVVEQHGVAMQVRFKEPIGPTTELNSIPKQGAQGVKYLLTHRGPISTAGYDVTSQFKSTQDVDRPDIAAAWVPLALDTSSAAMKLAKHGGIMMMGYQLRPESRSSIHASGRLPENLPVITPGYFQTETDRKVTSTILDHAREVFAQGPLARLIAAEEYPGAAVSTPEQALEYATNTGATIYHAVGANAMGPADDDVVDAELRVRGVDGLRVVDASVIPFQLSGNTAAPTMAVGWIAADLILRD